MDNHMTLVRALSLQERYEQAIEQLDEGIRFMSEHGRNEDAAMLQRLLRLVEAKHARQEPGGDASK
jgi:hypothetical protein